MKTSLKNGVTSKSAASPVGKSSKVQRQKSRVAHAGKQSPEGRETARLLEMTCRMSPNSVVISDARQPDWPIVFVNAAFARLTGYSSSEVLGRNCRFLQEADRNQEGCLVMREALSRGESCETTLRNYRKDGSQFYNHITISPLLDRKGRVTHFAAFQFDVTARILAEEELRWRAAFLEAEIFSSRDGIMVVDQHGKKILQNKRMLDLFKIPRHIADDKADEKQLQWVAQVVQNAEEFIEKVTYLYAHPNESGQAEVELKDGTILDRYSVPVVGEDGKHYGRLWKFRDISEQRRAQDRVRQSHARYRSLVESARDAIFSISPNGTFTSMNPACEVIWEISRAEWIGKPFAPLVHPDDLPLAREMQRRVLRGQTAPVYELRGHPSLSRSAIIEMTLAAQTDEGGKITGVLGVGRDITERKRSEAELENLHKKLLEASRLAGIAEIATGVLHNVGNVLNSVNVSAGVVANSVKRLKAGGLERVVALMREHEGDLEQFIANDPRGKHLTSYLAILSKQFLDDQMTIVQELSGLQRNIEHIKEIVIMQQNQATASGAKEILNVSELVESCLRMSEAASSQCKVEIVRQFGNVQFVNCEKHKMLQILVNLLRNAKLACEHSDREGKRITIRVAETDGSIHFSVMDNGAGISPENLARIFSHGFTTRKGGHGFGLHSSALAAKEMGGSLIHSSPGLGLGATFTLKLPLGARQTLNN